MDLAQEDIHDHFPEVPAHIQEIIIDDLHVILDVDVFFLVFISAPLIIIIFCCFYL